MTLKVTGDKTIGRSRRNKNMWRHRCSRR